MLILLKRITSKLLLLRDNKMVFRYFSSLKSIDIHIQSFCIISITFKCHFMSIKSAWGNMTITKRITVD